MTTERSRMLDAVILDALQRFVQERGVPIVRDEREIEVLMWDQTWGDTSCGFGGIAGQMITGSTTVVVLRDDSPAALVYHAGLYAYAADTRNESFWSAVASRRLPGKAEPCAYRVPTDREGAPT